MKKIFLTLPLIALMACSDADDLKIDNSSSDQTQVEEAKYFITLSTALSSEGSTRSTTNQNGSSSNNTQDGTDEETALREASLYFCKASDGTLVLKLDSETPTISGTNFVLKAEVSINQMKDLVGNDLELYVVGNPSTLTLPTTFTRDGKFTVTGLENTPIGTYTANKGNLMPLVNASKFEVKLSSINTSTLDDNALFKKIQELFTEGVTQNELDWDLSSSSNYTGTKGILNLERAVARLDYKDARANRDEHAENVYSLGDIDGHTLKMYSMQIFNVTKEAYLFRHTSEGSYDKATTTPAAIFGNENNHNSSTEPNLYNWVAGSDWVEGTNEFSVIKSFYNDLNVTSNSGKTIYEIKEGGTVTTNGSITITELLTHESSPSSPNQDGYYPWCYIMENTLPGISYMSNANLPDNATGLAFTFKVCTDKAGNTPVTGSNGSKLTLTMPQSQDYVWQEVPYTYVEGDADASGYFLTYYAYIKHNDMDIKDEEQSANGTDIFNPGPMKYGIVRNNIYQLSVESVGHLPNPEDAKSMYLQLSVNILPWNVRQNSFNF
ncbi:MAG: fimbria major subunit [Muribaculaceae bacterium]|nr:fimbria major subunit [Muribaculaceae bacterium]